MKAVGIRELKAKLSDYLKLVKSGDKILVTDRGEVIAQIIGASGEAPLAKGLDDTLNKLSEMGVLTHGSLSEFPRETMKSPLPSKVTVTAKSILDELRGEN